MKLALETNYCDSSVKNELEELVWIQEVYCRRPRPRTEWS